MSPTNVYLGDSVYFYSDAVGAKIYLDHGWGEDSPIYLEYETAESLYLVLEEYLRNIKKEKETERAGS